MELDNKKTSKLIKEILNSDLEIQPYPTSYIDRIDKFSQMLGDDQVSASIFSRISKSINQTVLIDCPDEEIDEFLQSQVNKITDTDLYNILTCIMYGFSVVEIVYKKLKNGLIGLDKLILKNPKSFSMSQNGKLMYSALDLPLDSEGLKNKIIMSVYLPNFSNQYGTSVLQLCYYYYEFKKLGWSNWSKAFSRLANPMLLLLVDEGADINSKQAQIQTKNLLNKIESGQSMFIQGIKETKILSDPSSLEAPRIFIEECNKAISRCITGTTMITNTPDYGTNALGQVQNENFYEYIKLDKSILGDAIQKICNNLVELNFPYYDADIKVYFDDDKRLSLDDYIKMYQAGIPFDMDDMMSKFNIKKRKDT